MRQTQLFTKTRKEAPKDEVAKNAELLIRAGFIHKEMAGVYAYLPLGLRVIENIKKVIREEMNAIGGQEILMTALQEKSVWEKTDRWDDSKVDNWFKSELKTGSEIGLAITHEEPITNMLTTYMSSYRDLPAYVYQFQTKFRNELRAKSGIMRGREFLMKDLYSFSRTEEDHNQFYAKAREAYIKIFKRLGLGDMTHIAFASGGIFSEFSEEFQTFCEAGEDTVYFDSVTGIALNKEVMGDGVLAKLGIDKANLVEKKSIEVGNIFNLGTKFSDSLGLVYSEESGAKKPVIMGSYGIGVSRLMGTLAEVLSDDKGLVWPEAVAPFQVHLVSLSADGPVKERADEIYQDLMDNGVEVLYDDRDVRAGEKFADSDLIGIPQRLVVSEKNLAAGQVEVKDRTSGEVSMISESKIIEFLK